MTIPASTVPAAKLAIYSSIVALVNDPTVTVSYDEPGPGQLEDDVITVGDVTRVLSPIAMVGGGGQGWLDEEYFIAVTVDVVRGGDDARTAFERAASLADIVVAGVRTDPSLGGVVVVAVPAEVSYEAEWATGANDEHLGRQVTVTIAVRCRARI